MIKALTLIALIAFACATVGAQTNWGPSVYGVRLSIAAGKDGLVVGATNFLHCRIQNSTTNEIALARSLALLPATVFSISDSSGTGKNYRLEPDPDREFSKISAIPLEAGKIFEWDAPVIIGREISLGSYRLSGCQSVFVRIGNATNYVGTVMRSNALEVYTKNAAWF